MKKGLIPCIIMSLIAFATSAEDTTSTSNSFEAYAYVYATSDGDDSEINTARVKMTWMVGNKSFFAEVDARKSKGQLNEWHVDLKDESGGVLRFGRNFLAAGMSTQAPFLFKTARYPESNIDLGFYGHGVQYERRFANWNVSLDLSGNSDRSRYDQSGQFDRVETSARMTRHYNDGHFALSWQLSKDFTRLAVDGSIEFKYTDLTYGFWHSDEEKHLNKMSGYVVIDFKVPGYDWFKPHIQIDGRHDGTSVFTTGIGFGSTRNFYVVLDYDNGGKNEGFVAKTFLRVEI